MNCEHTWERTGQIASRYQCTKCTALGWARQHMSYNANKPLRRVVIAYVCPGCKGDATTSRRSSGGERFFCKRCAPKEDLVR